MEKAYGYDFTRARQRHFGKVMAKSKAEAQALIREKIDKVESEIRAAREKVGTSE